jgi:hypothetical protein
MDGSVKASGARLLNSSRTSFSRALVPLQKVSVQPCSAAILFKATQDSNGHSFFGRLDAI